MMLIEERGKKLRNKFLEVAERINDEKESRHAGVNSEENDVKCIEFIDTWSALQIIYYLMAADGEIFHGEEEKFDSIGVELDPDFGNHKERIVKACQKQMRKARPFEDYYGTLLDGIDEIFTHPSKVKASCIGIKVLIWNLLSVAFSDEKYDDRERNLIEEVVCRTNMNRAIFLEMEGSFFTLMDIEKEIHWIKTTEQPYLVIEEIVKELEHRKSVIFESVEDLIAL
ncbi:hypothetical protein ACQRAR_09095 [Anaerovoracaceae bacterium SGI.174]